MIEAWKYARGWLYLSIALINLITLFLPWGTTPLSALALSALSFVICAREVLAWLRDRGVEWSWRWRLILPPVCDECGRRRFCGTSFVPRFKRYSTRDSLSCIWEWAFTWGPLHAHCVVSPEERVERLKAHNLLMRKLGW